MIQKRLVGVITVKQGWAVQSFGYGRHLPIGKPEVLAENLDRWGVDEILLVCIDRSRNNLGPDLALLERINRTGLSTPLAYQGGIRSVADAVAVVQAGAERVAVDSLLRDDPRTAAALAGPLGAQALIAALPLSLSQPVESMPDGSNSTLAWFDHRTRQSTPLPADTVAALRSGAFSEMLVVDWRHEGTPGTFDERLLGGAARQHLPLIAFGGLGEPEQLRRVLAKERVVAAAVGNSLSWREHAVQQLKAQLLGLPLRPPSYAQAAWA